MMSTTLCNFKYEQQHHEHKHDFYYMVEEFYEYVQHRGIATTSEPGELVQIGTFFVS